MFHRLSKHLEFSQKYSAARRIFNSLLGAWISRRNTVPRVRYITSNTRDLLCVMVQLTSEERNPKIRSSVMK